MQQARIRTVTEALGTSVKATGAATEHGVALDIKQNTAAAITASRDALLTAVDNHEEGRLALKAQRSAFFAVLATVITFLAVTRDVLKAHLGTKYSAVWDAAGFLNSLRIPTSVDKAQFALERLKTYLAAHPTQQNTDLNVTAVRADALLTDLVAAQNSLASQRTVESNLRKARNAKLLALITRLKGLFAEIGQTLDPLDSRWEAFGFRKPGAQNIPSIPENLLVVLFGPNALSLKWDAAARAEHYRVWKKVIGVDEELIPVGSPADLDFILESLPGTQRLSLPSLP